MKLASKGTLVGVVALGIALVAAASLTASQSAASVARSRSKAPVKIGGLDFLSGAFASTGLLAKQGMTLAVKQVNGHGGVLNGRKLVLDLQDTTSTVEPAISAAKSMAADSSIVGIVGPAGSPDILAMLSLKLNVPMLSYGGVIPITHAQWPKGMFRVAEIETPNLLEKFLAKVATARHLKKLAIITDQANASFVAETQHLQSVASKAGVKVVDAESYHTGDTSFSTQIDKIIGQKPSALWIAGSPPENGLIMQQARARGFTGLFIGGSGLQDPTAAKIAGASATGYVTYVPFPLTSKDPTVQAFKKAYAKAYPNSPIGALTVYSYDAVLLLARAIDQAGVPSRNKVMAALGKLHHAKTVEGSYSFKGKGDNVDTSLHLVQMGKTGAFVRFNP